MHACTEIRTKIQIHPVCVTVDQDTLDFLAGFGRTADAGELILEEELELEIHEEETDHLPSDPSPSTILVKSLSISPISLDLNYRPKRVSLGRLRKGDPMELINLLPNLEGLHVHLRAVQLSDISNPSELISRLIDSWANDLGKGRLLKSIASVTPLRSFANVAGGVAGLVDEPLKQLRRGRQPGKYTRHVSRGIVRGFTSFLRTLTIESLSLADFVVCSAKSALEAVDGIQGSEGSRPRRDSESSDEEEPFNLDPSVNDSVSWTTVERGARDYPHQPPSLSAAGDALLTGVRGASHNRHIVQPVIGATEAVSVVLRNARATLDRGRHEAEVSRRYRAPYTEDELFQP